MKKQLLCLLLCLAAPLAALSEEPALRYIDHDDGVNIGSLLSRADGGLVLCGYTYTKNAFQQGIVFADEYKSIRTDAYAVALDAEGREEWHLRFGDPEAFNSFSTVAPIRDGDYLLTYRAAMGTWGMQHYVIGADGTVKEMLPAAELREKGLLYTLRPIDGGFIGGGFETMDGMVWEPMLAAPYLQGLDLSMAETWRLEDPALHDCLFESASAGADGYAFCGNHYTVSDSGYSTAGSMLLRLDESGAILWQKKLGTPELVSIVNVLMLPDGGLLACGMGDPGDPDAVLPGGTLSKFDREGKRVWVKGYHADYGLYTLSEVVPLGDGYVITDGMAGSGAYYVDADGEVLGRYRPPVVDNAAVKLYPAVDGGLYMVGCIATPTDQVDEETPIIQTFYVKLNESHFAPVTR